jgi:hypothetical protein
MLMKVCNEEQRSCTSRPTRAATPVRHRDFRA